MRIPIVSALLTLCLLSFSCHQPSGQAGSGADMAYDGQKILGTYQGSFGTGIISLVFNYVNGNIVSGYEIHKGIRRNINGTLTLDGNQLSIDLKEPGNYVMDGAFSLKLDTAAMKISGTWDPFKKDQSPEKKLSLSKNVGDQSDWETEGQGNWDQIEGNRNQSAFISFQRDGYCEYSFYETSGDSTSARIDSTTQQHVVKGTYIFSDKVYKIEWQRNSYTPAQKMTMTIMMIPSRDADSPDSLERLVGNGWRFEPAAG